MKKKNLTIEIPNYDYNKEKHTKTQPPNHNNQNHINHQKINSDIFDLY